MTLWLAVPPVPVQVSTYVRVAVSAPVDSEPLVPRAPVQPFDALQAVALVLDQVRVELPPLATVDGVADRLTVGGPVTATVSDLVVVPPGPVQTRVKLVLVARAGVVSVPLVAFVPLHPPLAEQLVAPLLDHDSVEADPEAIELGEALKVTVGAGATTTVEDCDTVPPTPVQVRV